MVSYEVSIGFVIITVLLCVGSLNLTDIVLAQQDGLGTRLGLPNSLLDWHWLPLLPMFVIFFISALAETNRPPFDLVEAESELVAGYAVEYSSTPFLLFFLGEYVAIVLMCALTTILFLGGWLPPIDVAPFTWLPGIVWFVLKVCFVFFMFAMVKAFVPRYRYDQLMRLGWKVFLPISLFMVVFVAAVLQFIGLGDRRRHRCVSTNPPARSSSASSSRRFWLSLRYFFAKKATHQLPVREGPAVARASAASTRSAAIRTARSAASPASSARRSARRRRSPSRPARAATTAPAAPPATTSTW